MNEAGRLHGPTRAQSSSLVGLTLSGGQQVGHMNTSLRKSERSWRRVERGGQRGAGREMKGGGGGWLQRKISRWRATGREFEGKRKNRNIEK